MNTKYWVLLLLASMSCTCAYADDDTGNSLLQLCSTKNLDAVADATSSDDAASDSGYACVEYVSGVIQGYQKATMIAELYVSAMLNTKLQEANRKIKSPGDKAVVDDLQFAIPLKFPMELCTPDNMTNGQAARIVAKYLEDHPEELNKPSNGLIIEALRRAFAKQKCS